MGGDDEFFPRPGRIRSRGNAAGKRYLSRVHAAVRKTTRTIGGARKASGFSGTRIGRGAGVGHVSAARNPFAGNRSRRVIVKINIARAKSGNASALRAHVHYIQRDGVERDGSPGTLYDRASDDADGKAFVERGTGDRHQFRLIVSPEDADELGDLKSYTRELMTRAERDLGAKLDWVAADHFDTDNPHTHIVIRGREASGKDLVIAKDYITHGFRRRGSEIATELLGPRRENEIALMRRLEVGKERFTGLDRELTEFSDDGVVSVREGRGSYSRFRRALFIARLQKLERLGLARAEEPHRWRLSNQLEPTLRRIGRRRDIIRTMTRAVGDERRDFAIFDTGDAVQKPVIGQVIASGGSDELENARYLIIEGADGRTWHADIGVQEPGTLPPRGAVVEIKAQRGEPKPADRTVADIAGRNEGIYSDALHAKHDPSSTAAFRLAHKRRLEALRRQGIVTRNKGGSWQVPGGYLKRAAAYEARRRQYVQLNVLSWLPLEQLAQREAATWLDESGSKIKTAPRGFGKTLGDAQKQRREWLIKNGLGTKQGSLNSKSISRLYAAELRSEGLRLEQELGKRFRATSAGEDIKGVYARSVNLAAGRHAVIERSKEFTLVPWRAVLERQRGKQVGGIMRTNGVAWKFGRKRGRAL
ncbi:DUF3363 domain-containing protein [Erythrobacter aureus]|uniref:DUF3363 domain-containing protein n=1 Tax=Erythrobacter aureus TaxID=2182384 RepID=UPI003A94769A